MISALDTFVRENCNLFAVPSPAGFQAKNDGLYGGLNLTRCIVALHLEKYG